MSTRREPRPFEAALQALGIGALMLPAVGVVIRMAEYSTVPTIPSHIIFSESIGSLTFLGVLALVVPATLLAGLWALGRLNAAVGSRGRSYTRVQKVSVVVGTVVFSAFGILFTQFPGGPVLLLSSLWLTAWYMYRLHGNRPPVLGEVTPLLLVVLLVAAPALGLQPTPGQPVYVVSSEPSALPTGWYIQLGDSHDPTYLLTCSGDRVVAAPMSSIVSLTYGHVDQPDPSLVHYFETGRLQLGLQALCPAAPPTP